LRTGALSLYKVLL